ncbi:MAG: sulfotransferase family 2 domain-containing protein [Pseudooceanicola sp.]
MVIAIDALRVAYMAVPKAGCSTVKGMLAELDPDVKDDGGDDYSDPMLHDRYQTRRFRGDRWAEYKGYYGFTVIRDPAQRLLSVYTDRVARRGDLAKSKQIRRGVANLPITPDPDYFFMNLRAYMNASSIIKHHALPTHLFTGRDFSVYSRVYRIEDLHLLPRDLRRKTGRKPSLVTRNASGGALTLSDLNPRTQDWLCEWLAPEYAALSDFYESPFQEEADMSQPMVA